MSNPVKRRRTVTPTFKQRVFVKELVKTRNPTQAARVAYDITNDKTAATMAWSNMRKPVIAALMDKMGLKDEDLLTVVKRNLDATSQYYDKAMGDYVTVDNSMAQLKSAEIGLKLKGYLRDKDVAEATFPTQINIQYVLKNDAEPKEIKVIPSVDTRTP